VKPINAPPLGWLISIRRTVTPLTSTVIGVGWVVPVTVNEANCRPSPVNVMVDVASPEPSIRPIVPVIVLNCPFGLLSRGTFLDREKAHKQRL
jgi:hypothetical protein